MRISIRQRPSRILFVRCMYHVGDIPATFQWRISDISVFVWISLSYVRRIKAYVLRTCDVCMAYEVYV